MGHLLSCKLALGAEQFRGIFDDEDRPGFAFCQFQAGAGDSGEVHVAATKVEFQFGGSRAHPLSAADYAGEFFKGIGWQQNVLLSWPRE